MPKVNWIPCLTEEEQAVQKLRTKKRKERDKVGVACLHIEKYLTEDSASSQAKCKICGVALSFEIRPLSSKLIRLNAKDRSLHEHQGG